MSQTDNTIVSADKPAASSSSKHLSSIPLRIFAICLTSIIVAVHYTNYGPLIPTLINQLHIDKSQAGAALHVPFWGWPSCIFPPGR